MRSAAATRSPSSTAAVSPRSDSARPLIMRDMLAGVGKAVGSSAKLTWVSAKFLDDQDIAPWSDMPVWVPAHGDTAGFARRDIRKAPAAGLTYRPLAVAATDTSAWLKTQPGQRQAKLKAGLSPDREAPLLVEWKLGRKA